MTFALPDFGLTAGDEQPANTSAGLQGSETFNTAVDSQKASAEGNVGFVFNGAKDSQQANVDNNLGPVTDDDTVPKKKFTLGAYHAVNMNSASEKLAPVKVKYVDGPTDASYAATVRGLQGQMAQSSKSVKTRGATQSAVQSGLRGANPVDTNGVHIAAIQELNKQIESLSTRIAAIKAKRGRSSSKGA